MGSKASFGKVGWDVAGATRHLDGLLLDVADAIAVQLRFNWTERPGSSAGPQSGYTYRSTLAASFRSLDAFDIGVRRLFDRLLRDIYYQQNDDDFPADWLDHPETGEKVAVWRPAGLMYRYDGQWRSQAQARRYLPARDTDLDASGTTRPFVFGRPTHLAGLLQRSGVVFKAALHQAPNAGSADLPWESILPQEYVTLVAASAVAHYFQLVQAITAHEYEVTAGHLGELRHVLPVLQLLTFERAVACPVPWEQIALMLPRKKSGHPLGAMGAKKVYAATFEPDVLGQFSFCDSYPAHRFASYVDELTSWTLDHRDTAPPGYLPAGGPPAGQKPWAAWWLSEKIDHTNGTVHAFDGASRAGKRRSLCGSFTDDRDDAPAHLFFVEDGSRNSAMHDRRCRSCVQAVVARHPELAVLAGTPPRRRRR